MIGILGGIIGIVVGTWALIDRYKNRKPQIKVFAPYYFTATDTVSKVFSLIAFVRYLNLSQTPTCLLFETLSVSLYYPELKVWKNIRYLPCETEKITTGFPNEIKLRYGLDKVKVIDVFDENIVKYSSPLCGLMIFEIENKHFTKLRGEVLDSRYKKIKFEIDFVKQVELDPSRKGI